jgi:hypothetical protein
MKRRLGRTFEQFVDEATIKHNGKYTYPIQEYRGTMYDMQIMCHTHGLFEQRAKSHLEGQGCRQCWLDRIGDTTRSSFSEFVDRAKKVHPDAYSYPLQTYINANTKIRIVCKIHGEFLQKPFVHLMGIGCPTCGRDNRNCHGGRSLVSTPEVIRLAREVHGNLYDYTESENTGYNNPMKIECKNHGTFLQTPSEHIGKRRGCAKCAVDERTYTFSEMVSKAKEVHGDRYTYPVQEYTISKNKVTIICPKHGEFRQTFSEHVWGKHGCPKCGAHPIISRACIAWLDSLGIPNDPEHREVWLQTSDGRKRVDGFDPKTNTVYEYYGDRFHGNPKKRPQDKDSGLGGATYGDLYRKTMERETFIRDAGYSIITIWESDFIALSRKKLECLLLL